LIELLCIRRGGLQASCIRTASRGLPSAILLYCTVPIVDGSNKERRRRNSQPLYRNEMLRGFNLLLPVPPCGQYCSPWSAGGSEDLRVAGCILLYLLTGCHDLFLALFLALHNPLFSRGYEGRERYIVRYRQPVPITRPPCLYGTLAAPGALHEF
jgi:hypothetical protein